jgi:hypothetical protein
LTIIKARRGEPCHISNVVPNGAAFLPRKLGPAPPRGTFS